MAVESDYDLLILDLNLPKLDGISVLSLVRPKKPSLPVLVLTARSRVEDRVQSLDTGADDCLIKPFSFTELSARVRALLRRGPRTVETVLRVGDLELDRVERKAWKHVRELGKRPQVYVKISEVLRRVDGRVPTDLAFYRPRLDELWDIFGADRLLYGSDWPNSDLWAGYPQVLSVVREYFTGKENAAAAKYFWKNSVAAYRWKKRDASQPDPGA